METDDLKENRKKLSFMIALIIACIIMTYVFKIKLGIGRIYTHLFYIPIILACLWWEKRGLIVPVFLASFLVVFHLIFRMEEVLIFDFFRAIMFIIIGTFTAYLSKLLNKSRRQIIESHSKLKGSYKQLKESERKLQQQSKELKKSKKELEQRVDELERFHQIVVGRELKMAELKDIIKHLTEKRVK